MVTFLEILIMMNLQRLFKNTAPSRKLRSRLPLLSDALVLKSFIFLKIYYPVCLCVCVCVCLRIIARNIDFRIFKIWCNLALVLLCSAY